MQQIGMKYCYSYEEHNKRSLFFRKRWLGIGLYARGKHKAEYAKMQVFFPNAEQNKRSPSWISFGISKMDDRQDQASLSRRRNRRSTADGMLNSLFQIIHGKVQMRHLLLHSRPFRPYGRFIL